MIRTIATGLFIVSIQAAAAAPPSASQTGFIGIGSERTCTRFIQEFSTDPGTKGASYFTWTQGFISGLNAAAFRDHLTSSDLGLKSLEDQLRYLVTYCTQHKTEPFFYAALSLYGTMRVSDKAP